MLPCHRSQQCFGSFVLNLAASFRCSDLTTTPRYFRAVQPHTQGFEPVVDVRTPLSRKRMSISRTVSDLTGKSQSAGVERQPGVEHLICKARKPLLLRSGGPRLQSCRWCNRADHRGSSMLGFYRAVAKLRAYLMRPSDRLRGRKHAADGGKFRRDLQGRSRCAMNARVLFTRRVT